MSVDFLDAFRRHAQDAESLYQARRWANADHLFGLGAECGLKRLMKAFGMPIDDEGKPTGKNDLVHADRLWARYDAYQTGHHNGAAYGLPSADPFDDWNINQRYHHQNGFTEDSVAARKDGMEMVARLIDKAERDGLV